MKHLWVRRQLFTIALVYMFGNSSSLLVTIGGKGKSTSKLQFQTVTPCATDNDCKSLQNTTCIGVDSGSKLCRCLDMELPNLGRCWLLNKDLDNQCSISEDCYVNGNTQETVDCVTTQCQCKLGYYANEDSTICQEIEYPDSSRSLEILNLCLLLFTSSLAVLSLYMLIKLIRFSSKTAARNKFVC
ncbi:AAEL002568-PA [Aedes aegypti]|uniref:AAEL002568-PA n=1 Tax=Aedes aegypti TaxID=7159 RepID=Q17HV2_AEDAE|nr:AAEL002568-PA [Aedes aegypti]